MDDFVHKILKSENMIEVLESLRKFPVPEEFSLDTSYLNVIVLLDFMVLIDNNVDQLKNPMTLSYLKRKVKPSAILLDYIILEISNYYTKVHIMQGKGHKFPDLPDYWKTLKEYRDSGPAHRDKEHNFKNLSDYVLNIKKLDSLGIPRVIEDFLKYHKLVKTKI